MSRPKGSKNSAKPKSAKAVKPAKPPKSAKSQKAAKPAPATAVDVGVAGQSRRAITQNNLKSLMRSVATLQQDAQSTNGTLREKIAYAVEHHHLDKEVFGLIRKLDRKEPEKLLIFLENLDHYLDVSGLNDRADSVGKLPLGEDDAEDDAEVPGTGGKAETAGETADDGPPTKIKPATAKDVEVSRPQGVAVSQAPGGTVHMLPDRKAAAAS